MSMEKIKTHLRICFKGSVFSLKNLVKWLLVAGIVGLIVGAVASGFGHLLILVNNLRAAHPVITLGLPVGGLAIVFLYRITKSADDRGTNTVIASIHSSTDIPFKMTPLIFISTAITHLFGGSAGREGAALQLGGSIANKIGKIIKLSESDRKIIVACGMSAGFSALFGTPLAAAIFAMEVVSVGIMHYSALVPCVTASLIAHFMAEFLRVPPEVFPIASVPAMHTPEFFKMVLIAALIAVVSILFCVLLHKAEYLYEHFLKNQYLRIAVAGILVVVLGSIPGNGMYLGSGIGIIENILHHGDAVRPYSFLLKIVFTALTLGAGFKGGEIVPSLTVGAAFGCVIGPLLGLPLELATACGMVGVFCGVTNCPLASLLLAFELFGFAGMPYYLITVAVSYMLSGYFGLYRAQQIVYSKTAPEENTAKSH